MSFSSYRRHTVNIKLQYRNCQGVNPCTTRGDLTLESQILCNLQNRVVQNIVHVSGDPQKTLEEIAYWFGEDAEFNDDYIRFRSAFLSLSLAL